MPRAIVTARVDQYQFDKINKLVSDGIFASRSEILQTFIELGLEHCVLGDNELAISAEYKAKSAAATRKVAIYNLAKHTIEELSCLISMGNQQGIEKKLTLIGELSTQLSPDMYQQLVILLESEPIYQVARQLSAGYESEKLVT